MKRTALGLLCAGLVFPTVEVTFAQELIAPITPPMLEAPAAKRPILIPERRPSAAPVPAQAAQSDSSAPGNRMVAQEAAQPRRIATESYQDWELQCFDPPFDPDLACQISLQVHAGDESQVVTVIALAANSKGAAVQIALPLGIALDAAVQLVIGNGFQNKISISRCTPAGCLVEGVATDELLEAMRKGNSGIFVVEDEKGGKIEVPFSLAGFTAALDASLLRNRAE